MDRYGRYTVIGPAPSRGYMKHVLCRCDCGKEKIVYLKNLKSGDTKSCGCLNAELTSARNHKHGYAKTPTWSVWLSMMQRCSETAGKNRAIYFDRGIRVCSRWLEFANFLADMGERPAGTQIDRIDNSRGYECGNCRWVTPSQNSRNRRNNTIITYNGRSQPLCAWAEELRWPRTVISSRLHQGWSIDRIFSQPPRRSPPRRAHLESATVRQPA